MDGIDLLKTIRAEKLSPESVVIMLTNQSDDIEKARAFVIDGYIIKATKIPSEKIEQILDCIRATKIPQNPTNKLEEIICDADLLHLGEKNIKERGDLLREEFELRGIKKLSDIEWMDHSIAFFNQHHFFTEYAKKNYGLQKEKNLEIMKEYLDILIKSENEK